MWNANRLARRSLLAVAIPAVAAARTSLQRFEAVESHMGTLVGITLYATSQSQAAKAFRAAFAKIAEANQALSNYLPTSEANQLSTQWRPCSAHLRATLQLALLLQTKTDGAFDITLAPLLDLWRQVRKGQRPWPTPEEVKTLRPTGTLEINARGQARLTDARVRLDFGALGKGYAADVALAELGRLGIRSALVACSGDIVVSAPPPGQPGGKSPWPASPELCAMLPFPLPATAANSSSTMANASATFWMAAPVFPSKATPLSARLGQRVCKLTRLQRWATSLASPCRRTLPASPPDGRQHYGTLKQWPSLTSKK